MSIHIDTEERRRRLAVRHFLSPASSPTNLVELADALNGLHSTDPSSVHLAAWARMPGFDVSDMERALYDDRSLVRVLGMRRTLFVVPTPVAPLLQHGCAGPLASRERTRLIGLLEDSGVAADGAAWLDRVSASTLAALEEHGEATASELKKHVPELGETIEYRPDTKWGGTFGVSTRVLFLLATDGQIVRARPRGSWVSSLYRWSSTSRWAPTAAHAIDLDDARRQLAERWLRTFGPAPIRDLEWWSGWGKRAVARSLSDLDVVEVGLDGADGVALADDLDTTPDPGPWAALLPSLDSTVMGWKERGWFLGDHEHALFDTNGNAGQTLWWNGRIVGGWTQRPDGEVAHRVLEDVGRDATIAIEARVAELQAWLGERRFVTRFRTPLDKALYEA